ncbi:hypothetical protein ILUMI_09459 [Ignelater luminosus]|uniref:AAA-ATPase-like domain-containing protein n=1 Tax=Ignelater luminosus TaxID=2038154 RepID=A0A8K0GF14_IGNLU|nr:hypothetical protein ILUMI_09459 [Ignelater luminosus]
MGTPSKQIKLELPDPQPSSSKESELQKHEASSGIMGTPSKQIKLELPDPQPSSSNESELKHEASSRSSNKPNYKLGSNFMELLEGDGKTSFIDKTLLIKAFFECGRNRVLVTAPRCFGKTVNIDMLRHFLEIQTPEEPTDEHEEFQVRLQRTQNYKLFSENNLKIMQETEIVRKHFGRYPVISATFKCEYSIVTYERAFERCKRVIAEAFSQYPYLQNSPKLQPREKRNCEKWCEGNFEGFEPHDVFDGLNTLASYLYKHFEKKVFLLIDDYDGVIYQAMLWPEIEDTLKDIIQDCTSIIKNAAYGCHVHGAFITGVSHMGLCGLNIKPHRFLDQHQFVDFYGVTSVEAEELLLGLTDKQIATARRKYGGYRSVSGREIYSLWSLLEYANDPDAENRHHSWKDTGAIPGIEHALIFSDIKCMIQRDLLLSRGIVVIIGFVRTVNEILDLSLILSGRALVEPDRYKRNIFFPFLLEQGYLSHMNEDFVADEYLSLELPNDEIRQAMAERIVASKFSGHGLQEKSIHRCREFFAKIGTTKCSAEDFAELTDGLMDALSIYNFTTKADVAFAVSMLTAGLGYQYEKVNVRDRWYMQKTRDPDNVYTLTKENFSMVLECISNPDSKEYLSDVLKYYQGVGPTVKTRHVIMIIAIWGRELKVSYIQDSYAVNDAIHLERAIVANP